MKKETRRTHEHALRILYYRDFLIIFVCMQQEEEEEQQQKIIFKCNKLLLGLW